jgi:hypothetical protein
MISVSKRFVFARSKNTATLEMVVRGYGMKLWLQRVRRESAMMRTRMRSERLVNVSGLEKDIGAWGEIRSGVIGGDSCWLSKKAGEAIARRTVPGIRTDRSECKCEARSDSKPKRLSPFDDPSLVPYYRGLALYFLSHPRTLSALLQLNHGSSTRLPAVL